VEQQAELGQPFLEGHRHLPCVYFLLESHDEVVSITDDRNSTARMSTTPLVNPEIENVVREDVGEERADSRPLRRTLGRLVFLTALEDASLQPLPDEPEDSGVGDPVRQHPQQPFVVNRVKGRYGRLPISGMFRVG
jgi:hypothetical protein